jgi:hypothetical protein
VSSFEHVTNHWFLVLLLLLVDIDLRVKRRYHACLEKEAVRRLRMMRSVDTDEAKQIVKDVFRPCRYDLEPFGEEPKLIAKPQNICNEYERYRRWSNSKV